MRVDLVGGENASGLARDMDVLDGVLHSRGWKTFVYGAPRLARWPRWLARPIRRVHRGLFPPDKQGFDLTIFLESIVAERASFATCNVLVPNPERIQTEDLANLKLVDAVLCKSSWAAGLFRSHGCEVHDVGFTTPDVRVPGIRSDRRRWLHVGGVSPNKGTKVVLEAWGAHPEWPMLTVVARGFLRAAPVPANVRFFPRRLPTRVLRRLQSESGVHVCPSRAEGYGHTIAEGMSCGALVLTTDTPPMNEIVTEDRGILMDVTSGPPHGLVRDMPTTAARLAEAVERALALSASDYERRCDRARSWFEENARAFPGRFLDALDATMQGSGGTPRRALPGADGSKLPPQGPAASREP